MLVVLLLCSCAQENSDDVNEVMTIQENVNLRLIKQKHEMAYETLNCQDMYQNIFEKPIADIEEILCLGNKAPEYEEVFIEYQKETFPSELISCLEQLLYELCNSDGTCANSELFASRLKQFCIIEPEVSLEEMIVLFPELGLQEQSFLDKYEAYAYVSGSENCLAIFHYMSEEGKNHFLFCFDSGGSYGMNNLCLTQYSEGSFLTIANFDTQNNGYGTVINFQGDYYYVLMQYNYNLKIYDSIRVYRLGSDIEQNNVCISYKPQSFEWKEITQNEHNTSFKNYIDNVQKELVIGNYLETGDNTQEIELMQGDEIEDQLSLSDGTSYLSVDLMNMDIPVYFCKRIYLPSNYSTSMHLNVSFALYDNDKEEIYVLDELEYDLVSTNNEKQLIQIWFKELDGLVYMFQVFHLSEYNYLLNVACVQGNKVTHVYQELLFPQFGFEIQEGEIWGYY